ncbi:hypothetical protein CTI12_AA067490 [Artemisia annua]|uniref:Uncharacterized protein n=1 Tax=Artemisia annua TaxID=35608 RepID=A0A2U1Q6Z9_ARTAN|nr:hypothetical protein CTI12_AA067490 [Artemisia annua]
MDVASTPQYHMKNVDAVDFDESNQLQKLSWANHHDQKKNLDVLHTESNQLQKLSSSNHDNQKKKNLCDDFLEHRKEETRKARSILLSMPGFSPADLWDDAKLNDGKFIQSMKQEQALWASNTCTNCGYFNWNCWCKRMHYKEMMEAIEGPSTPIKKQPKLTLPSFLLG